jgi:hypothetical protein
MLERILLSENVSERLLQNDNDDEANLLTPAIANLLQQIP